MILPLATSGCIITESAFWHSVLLYNSRPNIINLRIVGAHTLYFHKVNFSSKSITNIMELFSRSSLLYEIRKADSLSKDNFKCLVKNLLEPYDKNVSVHNTSIEEFNLSDGGLFIEVKLLLAKSRACGDSIEIVIFDKDKNIITFIAVSDDDKHLLAPPFPYYIEFMNSGHMRLVVKNLEDADSSSAEWLADKLFMKLIKWANDDNQLKPVNTASLSLISIQKYTNVYRELKEKYGKRMVQIWPEKTDPLKFVYEDVAIASYLICLWNEIMPNHKPSFIDLGCGNGLLVYILQGEGYSGFGIDVRKRKIWDMYPIDVNLQEQTITPTNEFLFPETEWIIGNHSDELTPWIPVITARSNFKANFFLLPCCSYDFDGKKYSRLNTNKSQYGEYLDYVEEIAQVCGFVCNKDKLRIPSTKKLCLVSTRRNYKVEEFNMINERITNFITRRCPTLDKNDFNVNIRTRPKKEAVNNCTQLSKDLLQRIIQNIVKILLANESYIKANDNHKWNAGGVLSFSDIIHNVDPLDLKELKNECGGIQTLMRNHRYIFEIDNGKVKLRIPPKLKDVNKYKTKPCWFQRHHPQGCLHEADICAFSH